MRVFLIAIISVLLNLYCQVANAQQTLTSNYFQNDSTAQNILLGQSFLIESATNRDDTMLINSFATKFINGLRQVGYASVDNFVGEKGPEALSWLHKFQRINDLPQSDTISVAELKILDRLVLARETADAKLVESLPIMNIASGASSEPSSNHVAAMLTIALQSLPSSLVKWNSQNITDFVKTQGPGGDNGGIQNTARGICFLTYYPSLDSQCDPTNETMVLGLIKDDTRLVYTILHEYSHYLDGRVYPPDGSGNSLGTISTLGFSSISFDTSIDCNPSSEFSSWGYFKLKNPVNIQNEFITAYAEGYSLAINEECRGVAEDFAESFTLYVMQGNVFRKLAETKPVLAQKYEWLKNNAFAGKEYFTGNVDIIAIMNQKNTEGLSITLPYSEDFFNLDKDFVWDYQLMGSIATPIPEPQPQITTSPQVTDKKNNSPVIEKTTNPESSREKSLAITIFLFGLAFLILVAIGCVIYFIVRKRKVKRDETTKEESADHITPDGN